MRLLLILIIFVWCGFAAPPPKNVAEENVRQKIAQTPFRLTLSMSYFNERMFRRLTEAEDGNVVYSPFSVHTALSMAYLGAPENTNTSKELVNLLGFDPQYTEDYLYNYLRILNTQKDLVERHGTNIQLANKMFAAEDINLKPIFGAIIANFYNTSVDKVNFANGKDTVDIINNFVNEKTSGLIPELFDEQALNSLTKLVIVNAIYFKGKWLFEFDESETVPMEFHIDEERKIEYPHGMTMKESLRMAYIKEIGAKVLELPYENDFFRLLILLPDEGHDIHFVERNIGLLNTKDIKARMDEESNNSVVTVLLPRFEINYDWTDLPSVVKSFGVESIFDESKSNLTNIADEPLYLSNFVHKAIIKVNEEGSEAAGSSGLVIDTRNSGPKIQREFKADRPFLFYMYDSQNNIPIFVGRVVDPAGQEKLIRKEESTVGERINFEAQGVICSDIGYDTTNPGENSFSLPCPGQDTFHIRLNEEQQKLLAAGQ